MPSIAEGQFTLTQLPSSRVTGSVEPRRTVPITGDAVLGPLCTLADAVFTVNATLWAESHDGVSDNTSAAAAT